jgi:hypothetical protein
MQIITTNPTSYNFRHNRLPVIIGLQYQNITLVLLILV